METTQTIAQSIRHLMDYQGKSNKALAALLGCTENTASQIRRGKAPLSAPDLFTIARWLDTTTDQLAVGFQLVPVAA